jgi:hypothetical protein
LIINPEKCEFGRTQLQFLGHEVSAAGLQPIKSRYEVLQKYPLPQTHADLRRFLGLVNFYHRFIVGCAALTAPLTGMLPKGKTTGMTKLVWSTDQEKAFNQLRAALGRRALLAFPKRGAATRLCTDASDIATGAVLEQQHKGVWRPVGFQSKALRPAEQKYSAFDRELLAIKLAIMHFRPYLEATEFHVLTDHKPLTGNALQSNAPSLSAKQLRWWLFISEFTTDLRHVSGSSNVVADALSRVICVVDAAGDFSERLAAAQQADRDLRQLSPGCPYEQKVINGVLILGSPPTEKYQNFRPVVPKTLQEEVISSYHNLAHAGIKATQRMVRENFVWRGMSAQILDHVNDCAQCQSTIASLPPSGWPVHRYSCGHSWSTATVPRTDLSVNGC